MEKVNYEMEFERMEEAPKVFKPVPGKHKITILGEAVPTDYVDADGNRTPQIKLEVSVNNEKMWWYVSVAKTGRSLYGQLMILGREKSNRLANEQITLLVTTSRNKDNKEQNSYVIDEVIELMAKYTEKTEKKKEDELDNISSLITYRNCKKWC